MYQILKETQRDGIDSLIKFMQQQEFEKLPSPLKSNVAKCGGMEDHCNSVYNSALDLIKSRQYKNDKNDILNSIKICSYIHDLGKIGRLEVRPYSIKEGGQWVTEDRLWEDFSMPELDHTMNSIIIAQNFIKLLPEEVYAIWLMGHHYTTVPQVQSCATSIRRVSKFSILMETAHLWGCYIDE